MQALGKQVFLEVKDEERQTDSGLFIIEQNTKQYHGVWATVISVGPNARGVKTGDTVLVNKYDLLPFPYKGKVYQCVKDELIFGRE